MVCVSIELNHKMKYTVLKVQYFYAQNQLLNLHDLSSLKLDS